jgi:translation initiation factor IF-1
MAAARPPDGQVERADPGEHVRPAAERDVLEFHGVVREVRRGCYVVDVVAGSLRREALCTLGGRLFKNHIRVLPGDEVTCEVSPYDLRRGRITHRGRTERAR